jgi:hypothetical protein
MSLRKKILILVVDIAVTFAVCYFMHLLLIAASKATQ